MEICVDGGGNVFRGPGRGNWKTTTKCRPTSSTIYDRLNFRKSNENIDYLLG